METVLTMKHQNFFLSYFNSLKYISSVVAIAAISGLLLFSFYRESMAEEFANGTFDVTSDLDFRDYKRVVQKIALKYRPKARNDFCILGYVSDDNSRMVWILWHQGQKIILWEGQDDLDFSRRIIKLKTDVVATDNDVRGSTYLVTKSWVENLTTTCDRTGIKLHFGKNGKPYLGSEFKH